MKKNCDDFLSEIDDRKESEEGRIFQNKCALVSSQNHRMKKEEGATAAASHLPFLSGPLRYRPDRQRFHGSLQTIGKPPLTT